jgi:NTP pyrophosphatase (non-canonical NTP hydrolase)
MSELTLDQYQALAMRTAKVDLDEKGHLIHGALGISNDAGEYAGAIRDHVIYGKTLDTINCAEELGDLLWFVQYSAKKLGFTLSGIAEFNIAKLKKRYPEKYSDQQAIFRADKVDGRLGEE